MAQAIASTDVRPSFRPSFFFWMTVVMAFFIFNGFGLTYWMTQLPLLATYLTLDALAIAILIYDWRTIGKLSAASLIGAAFVFVPQLLQPLIVESAAFASLSTMLAELAHYR
jgi:hypothetical protein